MLIAKVTSLKDEGNMAMVCQGTFIGLLFFGCVHNVEYSVDMYVCTQVASSTFNDCMQAAVVPSFKLIMCMLYVHLYL